MPSLRELENWMTAAQAADIIGWSRWGVVKAAQDGRIRAVQIGRTAAQQHAQVSEDHRFVWILDPESVRQFAAQVGRERAG